MFPRRKGLYQYLKKIYLTPDGKVGPLGSINALYQRVKNDHVYKVSKDDIKRFLRTMPAYSVQKRAPITIKKSSVYTAEPRQLYMGDLAYVGQYAESNNNINWLLVLVDVFSHRLMVAPLFNKSQDEMLRGLHQLIKSPDEAPLYLYTDLGLEWVGSKVKEFWKKMGTHVDNTQGSGSHAVYAELYIQYLKKIIHTYMATHSTTTFINVLPLLVQSLNSLPSRTLNNLSPNEVNFSNAHELFQKHFHEILDNYKRENLSNVLKVGTFVRIQAWKNIYDKKYSANFSREIFRVKSIIYSHPVQYHLCDIANREVLLGVWYRAEITPIILTTDTYFQISDILERKTISGVPYVLCKWENYENDLNSWIPASKVVQLNTQTLSTQLE